jgi:hypothetical protein
MDYNHHLSSHLVKSLAKQVLEQEFCEYVLVLVERQSRVACYPTKHTFLTLRWSILEELTSVRP